VPALHFIFPGDPDTPTGGFAYDRRMLAALRALGIDVRPHVLPDGFPFPSESVLEEAANLLQGIDEGATVVIDGLAFGAMPAALRPHAERLTLIALIHHPLADETGLDPALKQRLFLGERDSLALAARVVTVSRFVANRLRDFGVAANRIAIVPAGVDLAPLAVGSDRGLRLLCVATLTPRKGHALLFEALAVLTDRPWRLVCVGSATRDPATAAALRAECERLCLADRVVFTGAVDRTALAAEYDAADVVVLASHYEGFGLVLGEATARGLPIIATRSGGTTEAVPAKAALFVPPRDAFALAEALRRFLDNADLRVQLRTGARAAREKLPTWQEAAERFAAALGLSAPE
jgi:glycosyltransferase involved in cell wall biosynthesis